MGMQIPSELASLLNMLGYTWPEADEEKLYNLGQIWSDFGNGLNEVIEDASATAQKVWNNNRGDTISAFQETWSSNEEAVAVLREAAQGAQIVGICSTICAGIVLALKINVIIQLTALAIQIAQAIATAVVTFGASLLEIPIFKMITGYIIDKLIDEAITKVLDG
jgi:hypothetical protein